MRFIPPLGGIFSTQVWRVQEVLYGFGGNFLLEGCVTFTGRRDILDIDAFCAAMEADKAAGLHDRKRKEAEAADDAYWDAMSAEIDKNGIGVGASRRFGRAMKKAAE